MVCEERAKLLISLVVVLRRPRIIKQPWLLLVVSEGHATAQVSLGGASPWQPPLREAGAGQHHGGHGHDSHFCKLVQFLARRLLSLEVGQLLPDPRIRNAQQLLNLVVVRRHLLDLSRKLVELRQSERRRRLIEDDEVLTRPILPRRAPLPLDPLALVRDRRRDHKHAAVGIVLLVDHLE
eukprot:7172779-Prymnesium_polylepis.1